MSADENNELHRATLARMSRLEVDDQRPEQPRRLIPAISVVERLALRQYLDALDRADTEAVSKHEVLPATWDRLKEMIYQSRQPFVRDTKDTILYRTIRNASVHPAIDYNGGVVVCRTHLIELHTFRFDGGMIKVVAVGVRERQDPYFAPECVMCRTTVAHGNRCYDDDCGAPLHPQWPAVYCSNACALRDI